MSSSSLSRAPASRASSEKLQKGSFSTSMRALIRPWSMPSRMAAALKAGSPGPVGSPSAAGPQGHWPPEGSAASADSGAEISAAPKALAPGKR